MAMPHIIVEYSANLDSQIDVAKLVHDIHQAALASGVFEIGAVRTRAARRDIFEIADGDPDNAFIHVQLRVAQGRDAATRRRVAQAILETVTATTSNVFRRSGLGLSVEIGEIDAATSVRLNNLHDRMAAKGRGRQAV
jgi:5-carboxymethyl-2-hydroxymuconate isomerase